MESEQDQNDGKSYRISAGDNPDMLGARIFAWDVRLGNGLFLSYAVLGLRRTAVCRSIHRLPGALEGYCSVRI